MLRGLALAIVGATIATAIACSGGSSPVASNAPDAGEPETDPFPAGLCDVTPKHLDAVAPPDCELCASQTLTEGATCYDVPVGLECERGDHPAWECNAVWRCTEDQHWTLVQAARTEHECSRDVFSGGACEYADEWGHSCYGQTFDGVCLDPSGGGFHEPLVRWTEGGVLRGVVALDRTERLGCGCNHRVCYRSVQCIDARYRRDPGPSCFAPP